MIDCAVAALRAGELCLLPTDTVYGLCSSPAEDAVARMYALKRRPPQQPTALIFADEERLLEQFPASRIARGPYTFVVPNPEGLYPWLTGGRPDAIGVRLPDLPEAAAAVVASVGCVAATSANLRSGPDPRTVDEVPEEIRAGCAALLDAGSLPGTPSTVIDLTGPEAKILREGAVPAGEALALVQSARSGP